jgi:hypothetical protein
MRRKLGWAVALTLLAGCQLPPQEQEQLRPLREHGHGLDYDQLIERARSQADNLTRLSFQDRWTDLQDLLTALEQTAQLIPKSAGVPVDKKAEVQKTSARIVELTRKLQTTVVDVVKLAGKEAEQRKKISEANDLFRDINVAVRSLPPKGPVPPSPE